MAADSATTVTQWVGDRKEERYFKGTHKIFQLSKFQPVGIMVYAAANLQGVPWDILVKDFREQHLRKQSFASLKGYAQDLFAYIKQQKELFSDEDQKHRS